jgi:hypothetical protein
MNSSFLKVVFFLVLVANGLWYYIKYVVRQNGYESHLFWGHFGDIQNLHSLANTEQDTNKKKNFQYLLYAFYIVLFLTLASFVFMFFIR